MTIWVLLPLLALLATIAGFGLYQTSLMFVGAGLWFISGAYEFTQYGAAWDITYILGFVFIGVGLGVLIDSIMVLMKQQAIDNMAERKAERVEKIEVAEEKRNDKKDSNEELSAQDKLRVKHGLKPLPNRNRNSNRYGGW